MRRIVPILSLIVLVAACATNPTPETNLTPVSFEIYLIHESPAPDLVQRTVEATGETILLAKKPDLTASDIKWAKAQINPISGRPQVIVRFTPIGADKLAFLTRENLGRRLAIVVDGKIISTPLIRSEIKTGWATIEGFKSEAEAQRLAQSLNRTKGG